MAVGEDIISVFNGAADMDAYNRSRTGPEGAHDQGSVGRKTPEAGKPLPTSARHSPRARPVTSGSEKFGKPSRPNIPGDWLLSMEIFEILDELGEQKEFERKKSRNS